MKNAGDAGSRKKRKGGRLFRRAVEGFLADLERRSFSPHTVAAYRRDLARFADFLSEATHEDQPRLSDFNATHVRRYVAWMVSTRYARRTVQRGLAAIRSLGKFLVQKKAISGNPALGLTAPRPERRLPSFLTLKEVELLFECPAEPTVAELRDRAVLELFYGTGVRLSELTGLKMRDIDASGGLVRVTGKGRKQRVVPLGRSAQQAIERYVSARGGAAADEPVFLNARGGKLSG
ncbi:MAG: tyrosine-type recombinase/integrase, partial [Candidatus Eisenbacteria bacterium]|nr:tyrosine-type recombinase/integrase [Candidatus Eisenbacteria bacterium]